jgi:hypothetical protein
MRHAASVIATLSLFVAWACPSIAAPAAAESVAAPAVVSQLETVTVSGLQPGPGLWRVTHGENEMWLLGTVSPYPKRMQWDTQLVDSIIAESQEVITSASINITSKMNIFRQMLLVPSLMKARKNPGKEKLEAQVPAAMYARWQVLAQRYLGRSRGTEKFRPIFAAQKLYEAALDEANLRNGNLVYPVASKSAKRHKVKFTAPKVVVEVADMKGLIKEFSNSSLDDRDCFDKTLTHVEHDLPTMAARANAWAVGDLDRLRALPFTEQYGACLSSLFDAPNLRKFGFDNLQERRAAAWLEAAESALKTNRSTFAMLPMGELLKADGLAAALRAKGYQVEAPGEESPEAPASASL